mmetsp:Transcript_15021/g.21838  ORF Transcript_15021/g.21838 Transcript_15021/m.21838 type:complete len:196 (+) Transcript_15021:7-594(+)
MNSKSQTNLSGLTSSESESSETPEKELLEIYRKRFVRGEAQYLVKWAGSTQCDWEDKRSLKHWSTRLSNFDHQLLQEIKNQTQKYSETLQKAPQKDSQKDDPKMPQKRDPPKKDINSFRKNAKKLLSTVKTTTPNLEKDTPVKILGCKESTNGIQYAVVFRSKAQKTLKPFVVRQDYLKTKAPKLLKNFIFQSIT